MTVTDEANGHLSGTGGLDVYGGGNVSGVSTSGTGGVDRR